MVPSFIYNFLLFALFVQLKVSLSLSPNSSCLYFSTMYIPSFSPTSKSTFFIPFADSTYLHFPKYINLHKYSTLYYILVVGNPIHLFMISITTVIRWNSKNSLSKLIIQLSTVGWIYQHKLKIQILQKYTQQPFPKGFPLTN